MRFVCLCHSCALLLKGAVLVQAPLQVYANMLLENVRRQRALQGADEVQAGHPSDGAADEHDAAGGDEIDVLQQLQEGIRQRKKEQRKQKKAVAVQPPPTARPPAASRHTSGPMWRFWML